MIGLGNPTLPAAPGQAPPFVPSGNPVWDEIQQAHSTLSPAAQRAISLSGVPQRAGEAEAGAAPLDAPPTEVAPQPLRQNLSEQSPQPLRPIASPSYLNVRGFGSPTPAPAAPPTPLAGTPAAPLGQDPEAAAHLKTRDDAIRMGSGIHQIHNPFLRGLATVGDAVGSAVLPNVLRFIPGTSLHHRDVVAQNEGVVNEDVARAKSGEESDEAAARADSLRNPPKSWKQAAEPEIDPAHPELGAQQVWYNESDPTKKQFGNAKVAAKPTTPGWKEATEPEIDPTHPELGRQAVWYNEQDPTKKQFGGAPVAAKPTERQPVEGELPLGDRVPKYNEALLKHLQILNPALKELPEAYALAPTATEKDFDRSLKLIEGHVTAIGTKEQRDQTNELHKQTMALAEANRQQHGDTAIRTAAFKAYTPAMDSAERFNIMSKNYEDAVKNHDQQAMVSLLMNHIGMTLGAQKGARMTKDVIHEAADTLPFLDKVEKRFDSDGVLSGIVLSPKQMRQMVDLGRSRFAEDVKKGRNEANYQGAKDEGPDRIPNTATINHYISMHKGDAKKATAAMIADGWTVK